MGAGDGFVVDHENVLWRMAAAAEHGGENLRVWFTIGMGDADRLLIGVDDKRLIALGDGFDCALAPTQLGKTDDLALRVAFEQRLDLKDGADGGFEIGQAAGFAEVAQVADGKDLPHTVAQGAQERIGFVDALALTTAIGRTHDKKSFAERGGVGVDKENFSVGEFLTELLRGHHAGGIGAADAGGHTDKQDIFTARENRRERVEKALRRNLRGGDFFALAHPRIELLRIKRAEIHADLLAALGMEGEGNDGDLLRLQVGGGEIGGGVCGNCKHRRASFYI